jgi:SAM-dependent methyltransferase
MSLNDGSTISYDQWLETPEGRYIDTRQKALILDLTVPRRGETMLDVGCGSGNCLLFFHRKGCDVTGIDSSASMLEAAKQMLGDKAELHAGEAEDLPFSDNEFDIVTVNTSLEFISNPEKAISEAIRVCRGRVFLGALNRYSFKSLRKNVMVCSNPAAYERARFFSFFELTGIIRRLLPGVRIQWGSVIFLPAGWYGSTARLEEAIPVMKNPFGAFLGFSFPVTFTLRTVQDIIGDSFTIRAKEGQPVQGVVREGQK